MIDTKALRELDTDSNLGLSIPMSRESVSAIADELDRLYLDHAPLTREELEKVLKEAGWQWNETLRDFSMGQESIWCDKERLFCEKLATTYTIPLSAVTRATLRNCGVIK